MYIHAHVYIYIYAYMYTYVYIYIYTYTNVHIQICIYIYIYTYACIHTYNTYTHIYNIHTHIHASLTEFGLIGTTGWGGLVGRMDPGTSGCSHCITCCGCGSPSEELFLAFAAKLAFIRAIVALRPLPLVHGRVHDVSICLILRISFFLGKMS